MIILKTSTELAKMQKAGKIAANALKLAGKEVIPGINTFKLDLIIKRYIEAQGASPSFLGYGGFPASSCISVNNVVIHGVPSKSCILKAGDIVSIDVGALFDGFHGDTAYTFPCGEISKQAKLLINTTEQSLLEAIKSAKFGNRIGDIAFTVQDYVESRGYSVVKDFVGHGIGAKLHEDPNVPNFGQKGTGLRLQVGMAIAIEPMVNLRRCEVDMLPDGSAVTSDGSLSAHFEHTVAITENGPVILTLPD